MKPPDDESTATHNDESALARCAADGDQRAFDLLYDRYFARMTWYFTIFGRREAKAAVREVMTELFSSLDVPSDVSFAKRAYRLARATEWRHVDAADEMRRAKPGPAKTRRAATKSAFGR